MQRYGRPAAAPRARPSIGHRTKFYDACRSPWQCVLEQACLVGWVCVCLLTSTSLVAPATGAGGTAKVKCDGSACPRLLLLSRGGLGLRCAEWVPLAVLLCACTGAVDKLLTKTQLGAWKGTPTPQALITMSVGHPRLSSKPLL